MIGRRLSHYRIVEPLGSGGMGEVYRARDERLQRDVALKVLSTDALADLDSRRKFQGEALALSRLNHARIATIHDFDNQDGIDFLVMELVPGVTLADRLQRGPPSVEETVAIGIQIAEALEAAHEAGVVHRDLKPGNVLLTPRRDVKVVDFGLARRIRTTDATTRTLTRDEVVGTLPYMAPEQILRGPEGGAPGVDLWALGVILYELLTGRRPFAETDPVRLMASILHTRPVPPRAHHRGVPRWLEAVVLRCLQKDPSLRYPSASAVLEDLKRSRATRARRHLPPIRLAATALFGVTALAVGILTIGRGCPSRDLAVRSLAVLPLVNLSGDPAQEFFADGMTEEVTTALSQIGSVRVISRTSAMQFKGAKLSVPVIARRLHVDWIVQGTIRRGANLVRISAQLVDAAKDQYLWTADFERPPQSVLTLQNDIARAIAEQIRARITPEVRARLASTRQVNPHAHESYLRGRHYASQLYSEGNLLRAEGEFKRAIDLDPGFASAYAGLAQTYTMMSSYVIPSEVAMPKARAAALRALEIDSTLAQGHAVLAYVRAFFEWDWEEGERAFRRTLALNPSDPNGHRDYGYFLVVRGRFNEAVAELEEAAELDPLSTTISSYQLFPLYEGRQYAAAIEKASRILASDSMATHARFVRAQSYLALGNHDLARLELERVIRESTLPFYRAYLGYLEAQEGKLDRARQVRAQLERDFEGGTGQAYGIAVLCLGLGDRDGAIHWLTRSVDTRSEESVFLGVDPVMDPLRNDPRFVVLLRRLRLSA